MVKIRSRVSKKKRDELQADLDRDSGASITEVGGSMVTDYIGVFGDDKSLIGLAALQPSGENSLEMYKLYVHSDHRNKGIAKKLTDHALNRIAKCDFDKMDVEVSESGVEFWNKYKTGHHKVVFPPNRLEIWVNGKSPMEEVDIVTPCPPETDT